jgi:hypothetical protein
MTAVKLMDPFAASSGAPGVSLHPRQMRFMVATALMTVRLLVSVPASVSDARLASSSRFASCSRASATRGGSQSGCSSAMRAWMSSILLSRLATSIVPVGFS